MEFGWKLASINIPECRCFWQFFHFWPFFSTFDALKSVFKPFFEPRALELRHIPWSALKTGQRSGGLPRRVFEQFTKIQNLSWRAKFKNSHLPSRACWRRGTAVAGSTRGHYPTAKYGRNRRTGAGVAARGKREKFSKSANSRLVTRVLRVDFAQFIYMDSGDDAQQLCQ